MVNSKENETNINEANVNEINMNDTNDTHEESTEKDNVGKTMTNAYKTRTSTEDTDYAKNKDNLNTDNNSNLIGKLEAELEEIKKKANENWDLALRAKAEVENIRKRALIDVENAHKYSVEKFAKEMLHVVDSLERGIGSIDHGENSLQAIHEGLELTYKLLLDSLEKFGIKSIDPIGGNFDPKQHEALSMVESVDAAPNSIVTVVQKGFVQHDRVLRHAKVIVAKGK